MSTLFTAIRAILYASGFILLWGWVASRVQRLDPDLGLALPATLRAPGIGLMVLGFPIALVCVAGFVVRGKGTPAPFDAPRDFVPSGPYRYVRNPMYIGAWLALVGFGLFQRSGSIVLFSLVLLFVVHLFVVFVEEPGLEKRFGESYLGYKRVTNRWLPRFSNR
ncbi:MAG TPA: isoprenylcysteine carboxylmethyltransferase family protein [Thermoanaerobaculia bacterium]|jgi:protein-S-isoprenylcysteine O-methyltransferase Ste14